MGCPPSVRPHCLVQVTKGSRPCVPADVRGQWSLPAVQRVLKLGAGVAQVEAFFGDGVVGVESHQDRVSCRVHLLRGLTEQRPVREAEDRSQGCYFPSPKSPALRKVAAPTFTRSCSPWKQEEDPFKGSLMGNPEEDRKQGAEELVLSPESDCHSQPSSATN